MLSRQGHPSVICGLKFVGHYGLGIDCPLEQLAVPGVSDHWD
jgi:hypothetical protein